MTTRCGNERGGVATLGRVAALAMLLAGGANAAWAQQIFDLVVPASQDNTLYQVSSGAQRSNGAGEHFFVGRTNNALSRRGVISFDVSGVPMNATIVEVELTLNMSRSAIAGDQSVRLHRALQSWGEGTSNAGAQEGQGATPTTGDATWVHRFFSATNWSQQGGVFQFGASASKVVGGVGQYSFNTDGLRADVEAWVMSPATNFGWVLVGNEFANGTAKRFDTRENTILANRPSLRITYTLPEASGACCMGTGCMTATMSECMMMNGVYQGDGTLCSPNPCAPAATGACCFNNGTCQPLTMMNCMMQGGSYLGDNAPCVVNGCPVVLTPFVDSLPIPLIATPVGGQAGGAAHYEMDILQTSAQLHRDLPPTLVWGYEGNVPGPTILAQRNQLVTVVWRNQLRDGMGNLLTTHALNVDTCVHGPDMNGSIPLTVTHLHGGHVPADSDGHPDDAFAPGQQSSVYTYPNDQPGATIWYHDHALGITRLNVMMGLAGAYIIRDPAEDALNLPSGEFDVPLIVMDRSFKADGSFLYPAQWTEHFFGNTILVNGKVWPFMNVKQGKYRFRVVNGSNSRTYTLSLSNGQALQQIASDSGLLAGPVMLSSLTIAPGERAELVIDFSGLAAGTNVILTNSAPAPFPGPAGQGVVPNVMQFRVLGQAGFTGGVPGVLANVPRTPESEAIRTRDFVLRKMMMHMPQPGCPEEMWAINDLMWDDITEFPRLGTTEIWRWINPSGMMHPMHMHLVQFQVLDRQPFMQMNGEFVPTGPRVAPTASEAGWKDTVQVMPNEIVRVIARFQNFAGAFAYHCHILEHEDNEMMRQFVTLPACDSIDFNNDGSVFDPQDVAAFLSVYSEGPCIPETATCNDIDFNNDGSLFDPEDINAFLRVYSEGPC